jgi:uncharacterized protein YutE (UPF0331/DUF86 family)
MTVGDLNQTIVAERILWVRQMLDGIRDLPIGNKDDFLKNRHYVAAAESYLRRALESLFDLGRHILAKEFAFPATEYKEIAVGLSEKRVIDPDELELMRKMAGYRNRMVHFYHEITAEELWDICAHHIGEIDLLVNSLRRWASARQNTSRCDDL